MRILLLVCLISTGSCTEPNLEYDCNGSLIDKSLPNIRHCIRGSWKVHYVQGGFTGNLKIELANTPIKFKSNDSIYFTVEGTQIAATKITWIRGTELTGKKTYKLTFDDVDGVPLGWAIDGIYSDTLRFYDDATDGYFYYSTRIQ